MNQSPLMVAVLAASDVEWLGRWRTLPGYEACVSHGGVWVRGPSGSGWELLPALARYTLDASQRLTPVGRRAPTTRMPDGPWQPLREFIRVSPPKPALPALAAAPIAWSLVPSEAFCPTNLMILPCEAFIRWGLSAPAVRLKPLRFAVADDGRACVVGAVLPPIPADHWRMQAGVATPAGWALPRGITAGLVATTLRLAAGETALIHPDGSAERLPSEAFVDASRGALRATAHRPLAPGGFPTSFPTHD